MTKQEFCALPPSLALGVIWDALIEQRSITATEAPKPARPPKYDQVIYRKEGVTYASEYDAEGLRFWHRRKAESGASGGQYAEKDLKTARALEFWLQWREQNPTAIWSGDRFHEQVTAKAPSGKPEVYPRDAQRPAAAPVSSGGSWSDEDYGAKDGDSEIPF